MPFSRTLALTASLLTLSACAAGPDYRRPAATLTTPYAHADRIAAAEAATADWWAGFHDPMLATVVQRALAQNLDLAAAEARVTQARAAARYAGAALLPAVDANASAAANHQSTETQPGRIAEALGAPRNTESYSAGLGASWEIDLFGGLRRGREAARADLEAAVASTGAVRVAIAAESADAYLMLRGLQAQRAVAEAQLKDQEQLAALVRKRVETGVSADRELQRAMGELEGARAALPPLRAAIDGQLNRLDVLMGVEPGTFRAELAAPAAIPAGPDPAGSLSPADLLRSRPDVVAAERRLAAANARIGVAVAEYYPHLSLGGLIGFAGTGGASLFTGGGLQAQGVAGLRWRLFDFGRVDAEVASARGTEAEALARYRGSMLRAAEDVETALSQLVEQRNATAILERQAQLLEKARDQVRLAYQGGVASLTDVLDADRAWLAASDRLAATRAGAARTSVAAFRALGGGWKGA